MKDQFHDGYKIEMTTDPREIKPDPKFAVIYKHGVYLADSHTIMVNVPSFPYTYMWDSLVAQSYAKDQKIAPCFTVDNRCNKLFDAISKAGQSTIPTHC